MLPPPDAVRKGHYDFAFLGLAVRNFAAYNPPVLPPLPGSMDECDILARLTTIITGQEVTADPERLLDAALRAGPYGLTLQQLAESPHGIDLGPLEPRLPEVLRTPSGKVELCPPELAADVERLRAARTRENDRLVLIGRRHLRSNNSWMHNVPALVKGRDRCTLQLHPADAERLGLTDGGDARVTSRVGTISARVEVTDTVMPGVVSLPHGWGHDVPGTRQKVAAANPGVNSNVLTDETVIDPLSGNSVLNGIPVEVRP